MVPNHINSLMGKEKKRGGGSNIIYIKSTYMIYIRYDIVYNSEEYKYNYFTISFVVLCLGFR